jgi:hypothetical protein
MSQPDRALIIGVGTYRAGIKSLQAVSSDVREIGQLLGSAQGGFNGGNVTVLDDQKADRAKVLQELGATLLGAAEDQTIFVYMAGHGTVENGKYFFLPHDTDRSAIESTSIPLLEIKRLFDQSPSKRLFLWLDFCHSGGILARRINGGEDEDPRRSIERALTVQGEGRVIMCACCPEQYAYESGSQGHYTHYLLLGLRGEAAYPSGEITAHSLHDYIVKKMPSYQQPMMSGEVRGSLVLMHSRSVPLPSQPTNPPNSDPPTSVIEETGKIILLNGKFYLADKVQREANGDLILHIESENAQQEADLHELKGDRWGSSKGIAFAHRNDGMLAQVQEVSNEYQQDKLVWSVRLRPEPPETYSSFGSEVSTSDGNRNYSADDIAELRAKRLLLNDPPAPGEKSPMATRMLETLIQGLNVPVQAGGGVIAGITPKPSGDPTEFLKATRLMMVFMLRATGVFERILELKLGPVADGAVHVRCRGKRRPIYTNRPGTEFTIEGNCPL